MGDGVNPEFLLQLEYRFDVDAGRFEELFAEGERERRGLCAELVLFLFE